MAKSTEIKIVQNPLAHKRKRWNKNTKKAHRKRIDISDVERTLEQRRREERHGGLLKERKSEDILFLDVGGTEEAQTFNEDLPLGTDPNTSVITELAGFKPMRRKVEITKNLRCHLLLKGLPGAKDPLKKRNRVKLPEERRDPIVRRKKEAIANGPKGKAKEATKKQHRELEQKKKLSRPTSNRIKDYGFDLWAVGDNSDEDETIKSYSNNFKEHYKRQTCTAEIKPPKWHHTPPSALPAVLTPDAGASYNPSYEAHQELLRKACNREEKRLNAIETIEKKTTYMFPTADKAPTAKTWLAEMSEGLSIAPGINNTDDDINEDGQETVTVSGQSLNERKTKQQRRKELAKKQALLAKQASKLTKMRESEVFRAKTFNKEFQATDNLRKVNKVKRMKKLAMKPYETKRLSKLKFNEDDIAVCLGDELSDSLRKVKPQINMLEEHYKSLQRRNIIEPRDKAKMVRKYKIKRQVKRSHRIEYEDLRKTNV